MNPLLKNLPDKLTKQDLGELHRNRRGTLNKYLSYEKNGKQAIFCRTVDIICLDNKDYIVTVYLSGRLDNDFSKDVKYILPEEKKGQSFCKREAAVRCYGKNGLFTILGLVRCYNGLGFFIAEKSKNVKLDTSLYSLLSTNHNF